MHSSELLKFQVFLLISTNKGKKSYSEVEKKKEIKVQHSKTVVGFNVRRKPVVVIGYGPKDIAHSL